MRSWLSFGDTTTMERFAGETGRATIAARLDQGEASVRVARDAGVAIATGSDFGGGSLRANQLAWEVTSLVAPGSSRSTPSPRPPGAVASCSARRMPGVIREGGPADFFCVHGDPLSDPTPSGASGAPPGSAETLQVVTTVPFRWAVRPFSLRSRQATMLVPASSPDQSERRYGP
jgi:hypothetical protein